MKNLILPLILLGLLAAGVTGVRAASIVLDSFSAGAFDLNDLGPNFTRQSLATPFTDRREADLFSSQESYATSNPGMGTVNFRVNLSRSGPPPPNSFSVLFTLTYSNTDNSAFSLLGYDAIIVRISELVGQGDLLVFGSFGSSNSRRIPIQGVGDIVYPLSNIAGGSGLESYSRLGFQFFPRSVDFSITFDEIKLVPEPSSSFMAAAVSVWLILRRERGTSC
jgi:hypothetical protein